METLRVPSRTPGDIDNRLKALSDLLQEHGIVENDRLCPRLLIERGDLAELELTVAPATAINVRAVVRRADCRSNVALAQHLSEGETRAARLAAPLSLPDPGIFLGEIQTVPNFLSCGVAHDRGAAVPHAPPRTRNLGRFSPLGSGPFLFAPSWRALSSRPPCMTRSRVGTGTEQRGRDWSKTRTSFISDMRQATLFA
jgi:hypothetical protein